MGNNIINFENYYYQKDDFKNLKELAANYYFELIYYNFKGISILEPLSPKLTEDLICILNNYQENFDNISLFTINVDNKKRIVLRRINPEYSNVDMQLLEQKAEIAYQNGNNEEAADIYFKILQGSSNPKPYVYLRLGELFPDFGLDYLIIATALATDDIKENYQNILKEARINKEKGSNYNIGNIEEIMEYIENSKLDVEEACLCLGMNREETDIVKLKIARIYFTNKHYDKGEEFIRSVESSPNKTTSVKNLLNEVVANKKIYSNDYDSNSKKISLKLRPGKHH